MAGPPIPQSPHELMPAWLTAALTESGALAGERVIEARWERVGQEYGFTGVVARVELGYDPDRDDLPRSLIAKLPLARDDAMSGYRTRQERDPELRRRYYERCAREVRCYREVAPSCAPRAYYAAADGRDVVLLLEDLGDGRQGDVLVGCSIDEAALVLDEIAAFHAEWWGERAPPRFASLVRDPREWQERYGTQVTSFLVTHGDTVPPEVRRIAVGLSAKLGFVAATLYGRPRALVHGDLHLDNVLFDCRGPGSVAIVDWQGVAASAPAWDVTLFLVDSLSSEDRRASETALLERYLARLAERGVRGYTLDELVAELRLSLLTLLAGTIGWLANSDLDTLRGRERILYERALGDGRLAAALRDHDVEALLAAQATER